MTRADMAELVAQIERLWYGAKLADAMRADRQMFEQWYEILEPIDAADARAAIKALNGEPNGFPPRPGQIARRADDIAEARYRSRPADLSHLQIPEGQKPATPEQWDRLNAIIDRVANRRLTVVE